MKNLLQENTKRIVGMFPLFVDIRKRDSTMQINWKNICKGSATLIRRFLMS